MPEKKTISYITNYRDLYEQVYDSQYDSESDNYVAAISSETAIKLETPKAKFHFVNIYLISIVNSSSGCSMITRSLAKDILKTTLIAQWT